VLSQAFVEVAGEPNFEATRIMLWLQTQQVENTDVVQGSIGGLYAFSFLPSWGASARSKCFQHSACIFFRYVRNGLAAVLIATARL